MSYREYVVHSSFLFWSLYFFIGMRCERFQALDKVVKREVLQRLAKNVVTSILTTSIFFFCFGEEPEEPIGNYSAPTSLENLGWLNWNLVKEMGKMLGSLVVADAWFFHLHKLFHRVPYLLTLHRIHHRFQVPLKITAMYCHWTEMAFVNILTVLIGPRLFHMHQWTFYLWAIGSCLYTMLEHDQQIVGPFNPEHHLDHHRFTNCNFGQLKFWDWLYGTLAYRERNPAGHLDIKINSCPRGVVIGTEP